MYVGLVSRECKKGQRCFSPIHGLQSRVSVLKVIVPY
jgi:hypothetical protein